MAGSRNARVAEQIQRELAELVRDEVKDPRVRMVTFTGVDVSPDFAHAKVYFSTLSEGEERTATVAGLRRAAGFLRGQLGRRLHIHNIPELHFELDTSTERGIRLSRLIDDAVADKPADDKE